jgi:hypothetical protein
MELKIKEEECFPSHLIALCRAYHITEIPRAEKDLHVIV